MNWLERSIPAVDVCEVVDGAWLPAPPTRRNEKAKRQMHRLLADVPGVVACELAYHQGDPERWDVRLMLEEDQRRYKVWAVITDDFLYEAPASVFAGFVESRLAQWLRRAQRERLAANQRAAGA